MGYTILEHSFFHLCLRCQLRHTDKFISTMNLMRCSCENSKSLLNDNYILIGEKKLILGH